MKTQRHRVSPAALADTPMQAPPYARRALQAPLTMTQTQLLLASYVMQAHIVLVAQRYAKSVTPVRRTMTAMRALRVRCALQASTPPEWPPRALTVWQVVQILTATLRLSVNGAHQDGIRLLNPKHAYSAPPMSSTTTKIRQHRASAVRLVKFPLLMQLLAVRALLVKHIKLVPFPFAQA